MKYKANGLINAPRYLVRNGDVIDTDTTVISASEIDNYVAEGRLVEVSEKDFETATVKGGLETATSEGGGTNPKRGGKSK